MMSGCTHTEGNKLNRKNSSSDQPTDSHSMNNQPRLNKKINRTKLIEKNSKNTHKMMLKKYFKNKQHLLAKDHSNGDQSEETVPDQQEKKVQEKNSQETVSSTYERERERCGQRKEQNLNLPSICNQLPDKLGLYCEQIYEYLSLKEISYVPQPLKNVEGISEHIRGKLVEWIFNICKVFKFKFQTAFLAVNILDRCLGKIYFHKTQLQILSITSVFVAAKYQEVSMPKLQTFLTIPTEHKKTTKDDIISMEGKIMQILNFDFGYITPITFINLISCRFLVSEQEKQRSIEICINAIMNSQAKFWRSNYMAWYSLYNGCPSSPQLQTFILNNSSIRENLI